MAGRIVPKTARATAVGPGVFERPAFDRLKTECHKYVLNTYARSDVAFIRGEGEYLYDTEGERYLDFSSGIAVTSIGFGHPAWRQAVHEQTETLAHTSNLFYIEPQIRLAQR